MKLNTPHGGISLPAFLPDGTVGVVRSTDSNDLVKAGVEALVVSTFHLLAQEVEWDLHELISWSGPILTDSGGFQVFSLLRDNPGLGKITDEGFSFIWGGQHLKLSPERSIQLQLNWGADILVCLDQCTDPSKDYFFQKTAVERTIKWARRCKEEFSNVEGKKLFAVIQGGRDHSLRKYCAEELIKIGFDGYCYGGWPIDTEKRLLADILEYTASLMPDDKPKYALGLGKPEDIVACVKMGYSIFDCVIPTREARHKRIYCWESKEGFSYRTITIGSKVSKSPDPISKFCDCYTCQNFSLSYLIYLFKIGDTLSYRLATIHNLRFYTQLMERLRSRVKSNKLVK